jgi:phage gpG-like protein
MALSVHFSTNTKKIQKKFNRFLKRFHRVTRKGLEQAGEQLRRIIEDKTTRGEKYTSGRFVGYSPEYSALKGKTIVDLQDSNRMLQSMKSRVVNNYKSQVYFNDMGMGKRAYWHQTGSGNLPERPFFGFNKKVENVIKKQFENLVSKEIRRLKL